MVLSLNVRSLVLQSANEAWQPAFAGTISLFYLCILSLKYFLTEMTPAQLILRKLVTLHDLTVCLDRRNSSGKIEFYEVIYKVNLQCCSKPYLNLRNRYYIAAQWTSE
jgi:vacuolar protein sorting-associated protein 13B